MMKWVEILFWIVICSVAGLSGYCLYNAIFLFWYSSGALIHAGLRQIYILEASLWFVGFLVCSGGLAWLLKRRRGHMDQLLRNEE